MNQLRVALLLFTGLLLFSACSVSSRLPQTARATLLQHPALQNAHLGISIYEPSTGKYWYNYGGDKYFVPASNTKLATAYAAMKYLGDSLAGLRYETYREGGKLRVSVEPTGDPTFLHPDFKRQPVVAFFQSDTSRLYLFSMDDNWKENGWGPGWAWNDFAETYMAERSAFPIYGNVVHFYGSKEGTVYRPASIQLACGGCWDVEVAFHPKSNRYTFTRLQKENLFLWYDSKQPFRKIEVPFIPSRALTIKFLNDTIRGLKFRGFKGLPLSKGAKLIYSQPTDSLLRPMLHRSDNFFAEQALLMVSNAVLGYMNDEKIIDTLLKTDFATLPQPPRWVDGSGLSRYNLFTPQDFVAILHKMQTEFGTTRLKTLLPTGNEGTLRNYYTADSTALYAKTGTLSGVVALSGFLTTRKGRQLIFSVLVNHHRAPAGDVRRAVESFLHNVRQRF